MLKRLKKIFHYYALQIIEIFNMKIKILRNRFAIIDNAELHKISLADSYIKDKFHVSTKKATETERSKTPRRADIINFILRNLKKETNYLEIGVRDTKDNFDLIKSKIKYGVDPGYESEVNNVDFKVTSDEFFTNLRQGQILQLNIKFDVIFIDGLHLANQVQKDLTNSLEFLSDDGFIVMHDCNPPTEFHASENYSYRLSPSAQYWNGTTWKAFFEVRQREDIYSCCIDTDWGVGIISKKIRLGERTVVKNDFFEYYILNEKRKESLNLISFETFKNFFD